MQTQLGLCFVPFPGPSSSSDQVFGEHSLPQLEGASYHPPHPSHQFSGCTTDPDPQVCCVSLLGSYSVLRPSQWMSTVQNPKKSWLAMKPDCSLVEDAYLKPGLTLPALDALACLSPVGDGPVCSQAWKCIQFSSVQFSSVA